MGDTVQNLSFSRRGHYKGSTIEEMKCVGKTDGGVYNYEAYIGCDESGLFGYSTRIMPNYPNMVDHFDLEKMRWIDHSVHQRETEKFHAEMAGVY